MGPLFFYSSQITVHDKFKLRSTRTMSENKDTDAVPKAGLDGETSTSEQQSADWLNDPRIAFNHASQKWIFEDTEKGLEYEYNEALGDWIPVVDEEAVNLQQQAYVKEGQEEEGAKDVNDTSKRKADEKDEEIDQLERETNSHAPDAPAKKKPKKAKQEAQPKERQNKAIYVSQLPLDTTIEELGEEFGKYGLIADDLRAKPPGQKRIKLYTDSDGKFKGDALIVYFKPESVALAVQMKDNTELRLGDKDSVIKVEPARYTQKEGDTADKPAPPVTEDTKKKKQIIKQYQKMNDKLADWDDDDAPKDTGNKRWEKVVILKHVFTLEELAADVTAASDIKEDMIAGCEPIGPVTNVVLYDAEPEGVVSVKFQHKEDAVECVRRMNGRFFGGQKLEAFIYDGRERYQRAKRPGSTAATAAEDATAEQDEEQRLQDFGNWLESQT